MQLVTFFAPKGRSGRTTAMMATASSDRDTERLARAAFTGTPMLLAALPGLDTFGSQVNTGMLHTQPRSVIGQRPIVVFHQDVGVPEHQITLNMHHKAWDGLRPVRGTGL